MKNILLYLWQLPQNILGLMVILFSNAHKTGEAWLTEKRFGVSLGRYIIVWENSSLNTIKHEKGHQKQSLYLGWLYLLVIGLPSALGNLYDRWFHKSWDVKRSIQWYYSQPWEAWADRLGCVVR